MDYKMEELLPLVARLTEKYTSMESSSVPYETAQMLMEAVLYCLNENFAQEECSLKSGKKVVNTAELYNRGYQIVIEKVHQAKQIYEEIIDGFEDYGCRNYHDTLIKGMPAFFLHYDAKFQPQNHILTLDYPLLVHQTKLAGIDLILEYLKSIRIEQEFLSRFDPRNIIQFFDSLLPEYQELYLDNLCYPILQQAIGCIIADQPVYELHLSKLNRQTIKQFLNQGEKSREKIVGVIRILTRQMNVDEDYFQKVAVIKGAMT